MTRDCCPEVLFNRLKNVLAHPIQFPADIMIGKPEEMNAVRFNVLLPALVILHCPGITMAVAVNLDRELEPRTIEVENILINSVLAEESFAVHAAVSQLRPEDGLGFRHVATKAAAFFEIAMAVVDSGHCWRTPLNPPFKMKGGGWRAEKLNSGSQSTEPPRPTLQT